MLTCKRCYNDVMITIDDICLICNPPTEKQTDMIVAVLSMMMRWIKAEKMSRNI